MLILHSFPYPIPLQGLKIRFIFAILMLYNNDNMVDKTVHSYLKCIFKR